jgi:MFS transporter, PPP family, 3-phenylpropionic acid transporter
VSGIHARLAAFYFAYFGYIGAFSPYFSLYLESIGKTAFEIGVLLGLSQAMRIVGPWLWGTLAQRTGATLTLMRVAAICAVGLFALIGIETRFGVLFALLLAMNFFTSALMPLNEAMTLQHLGDDKSRYGPIRMWGSVGFIVSVLGLGYALDVLPVRAVVTVTLAMMAAMALMTFALPATAPHIAHHSAMTPINWQQPALIAFLFACLAMCFAHAALYNFYSIYLKNLGYNKATIGWLWTIGVIAEVAVFAWLPRVQARLSLPTLFIGSLVICFVRFLMIAWGAQSFAVLLIAQLMHAITFALYHGVAVQMVERWFGKARLTQALSVYIAVSFGIGGLAGGLSSGAWWDQIGPQWTFTMSALAAALGAIVAFCYVRDEPAPLPSTDGAAPR